MNCIFCHKQGASTFEKDINELYCQRCHASVRMFVLHCQEWLKAHCGEVIRLVIDSPQGKVAIKEVLDCEPYTDEWFVYKTQVKYSQIISIEDDTITIQW